LFTEGVASLIFTFWLTGNQPAAKAKLRLSFLCG